ncbi:MAG: hypothetical protein LBI39_04300 [Puniceicoccales bacterium]|nr:hypothetical protein [Puniceicoccales bacterium]
MTTPVHSGENADAEKADGELAKADRCHSNLRPLRGVCTNAAIVVLCTVNTLAVFALPIFLDIVGCLIAIALSIFCSISIILLAAFGICSSACELAAAK